MKESIRDELKIAGRKLQSTLSTLNGVKYGDDYDDSEELNDCIDNIKKQYDNLLLILTVTEE